MMDDKKQEKQLRVAFYIRVSTEDQVERYGIDLQKRALNAVLESRGVLDDGTPSMKLAGDQHIYMDEGISGTTELDERPGFAKLKEDIINAPEGKKPFDLVAVYKIDRFARRLKILLDVIELFKDHEVKFISVHESIDTSTPFGRAILGIVGVLSELEMETIKIRTAAGRKEAVLHGVFMGNVPPYGYIKDSDKRLIILKPEAEIVSQIYDKVLLERLPISSICRYLEKQEVESPGVSAWTHGKRGGQIRKKSNPFFWSIPMINKILTDEVYMGKYFYNKTKAGKTLSRQEWKLSPHAHEGIIDEGSFLRVQNLLGERKIIHSKPRKSSKYTYLLSGLLKCDCCYDPKRDEQQGRQTWYGESKEIGKGSGSYTYYYKCRRKNRSKTSISCGALPLPAKQIEDYVLDRMGELLSDPAIVYDYQNKLESSKQARRLLKKEKKQTTEVLNGIPKRRKNLKAQQEHDIITMDQLKDQLEELDKKEKKHRQKIKELEAKISSNKLDEGYISSLELFNSKYQKAISDLEENKDEIKQILQIIIDKIIIFSRPITNKDVIAGRRSENQKIPHKIIISLRLPQEYLKMLEAQINTQAEEFGVKLTNLSG